MGYLPGASVFGINAQKTQWKEVMANFADFLGGTVQNATSYVATRGWNQTNQMPSNFKTGQMVNLTEDVRGRMVSK